jgi:hypothetical protein
MKEYTMATPITHEEAVTHKQQAEVRLTAAVKTWHVITEPNPTAAVGFLNLTPAQGAGEAFASNRSDGQVDLYYFL